MLCNHAEAADNRLFISGGGIDQTMCPPAGPFGVHVGIGILISVPYTATNQAHRLEIRMVDEDQTFVQVTKPDGSMEDFFVAGDFNVGRPPGLPVGAAQNVPLAVNVGVGVPHPGLYHFEVSIDGNVETRLPMTIMAGPPQFGGGTGPSAIPPMPSR